MLKSNESIISVTLGRNHTCVSTNKRYVYCLGKNKHGETNVPAEVQGSNIDLDAA